MKSAADKKRASDFYRNASAKQVAVAEDIMHGRAYWHSLYGMSEEKERAFYTDLATVLDLEADGQPLADAYKNQPLKHFSQAIAVRIREIFAPLSKTSAA
ncbi:MAG: hypothetical protein RSG77_23950 [Hafnia sp.]